MFCARCGKEIKDTDNFCPFCGSSCEQPNKTYAKTTETEVKPIDTESVGSSEIMITSDNEMANANKPRMNKGLLIAGILGGIVLVAGILIGMIALFNKDKNDANNHDGKSDVNVVGDFVLENTVSDDASGEETPLYYISDIPVIDIHAQNYTPNTRTEGISWDNTLFYWLEDVSASDNTDGNIKNCVIYKTYMRDADTGNLLQYEVYANSATGQIYKIVSIEQLESSLQIIDYYYDDGKPNFIFLREDSVYTPTYATIGKVGNRYYFNDDVMVKWRNILTPNVINEYTLTASDVTYAQTVYSSLSAEEQNAYDITENQMLNAAYNTYNAILNTKGVGIVEGRLVDTTGTPLGDMKVKIYRKADDVLLYETVTGADGYFKMFTYLDNTECYLVVDETDIFKAHITYHIYLHNGSYGYSCNDVVMHKIDGDEYPVYVDLYSALEVGKGETGSVTGALLQGATVSIREGSNAYEGDVIKVLEADSTGRLCAYLPSGIYTAQVQMTGYADSYLEVIVNESETVATGFLLPLPNQGETGVVMTWSGTDVDLDLTLFTTYQSTGGDMAHIGGNVTNDAYGNRLVSDNSAYCEVMYVNTAEMGNYKLFVNNYTDSLAGNYSSTVLANIDIYVYIYDCNGFETVYTFPLNQSGVVWEVVEINGTNLTPVHRVYEQVEGKAWWVESKEAKRLVKELHYTPDVDTWLATGSTEYVYDNAGRVIQECKMHDFCEIIDYTYDSNGRIETKTSTFYYDDYNKEPIIYSYIYDDQGNLMYIYQHKCDDMELLGRTEYYYDNMGRVSGYKNYYIAPDGSLHESPDYADYSYDENGNINMEVGQSGWTIYHLYDSTGNLSRSIEGQWEDGITAYTEYIYENATGNIISTDDWRVAYCDMITTSEAENASFAFNELKYNFVYLDNDNIPELVVDDSGYWVSVYTYKDGKVYTVMDKEAYGTHGRSYDYSPQNGVVHSPVYDGAGEIQYDEYYKMNEVYSLEYAYNVAFYMFSDLNGNGYFDLDEPWVENPDIWYNDQQINEAAYNALPYTNYSFEALSGNLTVLEAIEALQNM